MRKRPMIDGFCEVHICSIKPVWVSWWRVDCCCASDNEWAGSISAQIVPIAHGSFNSVHSQTAPLNDSFEIVVFASVFLLENLLNTQLPKCGIHEPLTLPS